MRRMRHYFVNCEIINLLDEAWYMSIYSVNTQHAFLLLFDIRVGFACYCEYCARKYKQSSEIGEFFL